MTTNVPFHPLDLERLIRWQCCAEGKSPKERDMLLKWFVDEPKEGTKMSTIQKACRLLLTRYGWVVNRQTLRLVFQHAGGTMDPSQHFNTTAAHRYGHDNTQYPPYVKEHADAFTLNPTVHAAVRLLLQEQQKDVMDQLQHNRAVCWQFATECV